MDLIHAHFIAFSRRRRSHSSRMMKPGRMSDKFGPVTTTLLRHLPCFRPQKHICSNSSISLYSPTMAQATPRSHPPPYSLLQNLTTQSLLLSHLFTLIASPPNPNTSTQTQLAQVYSALQLSTLDLSGLVREVGQHQEAYRRLVEKKKEVAGLEMRVRGLVKRLEEGRKELEGMIDQGEKSLQDIEKSERGASFSISTFWQDPGANPTQNQCRQRRSWHTHSHYRNIHQHLYQAY